MIAMIRFGLENLKGSGLIDGVGVDGKGVYEGSGLP